MLWFFLLVLLLLSFVLLLPPWPYMSERELGYGPSGVALALLGLILFLWWFGMIAVWWPWAAAV